MMQYSQWNGFRGGEWQRAIDVRSFIQKNYTLYEGDDQLSGAIEKAVAIMKLSNEGGKNE